MCPFDDEDDLGRLKPKAVALWHQHQRTADALTQTASELEQAKARIKALEAELRGKKGFKNRSERRGRPTPAAAMPKVEHPGHGPRPQPGLEARETVWDVDEPDRTCTACGGALEPFPEADEVAEEIDVEARHFVKRVHRRRAYRCRCGACIETAFGPEKLQPGGRYSVDFAIEVAVGKYVDHLPLERQVRAMARDGLVVDSQTLWDQLWALSRRLVAAYEGVHAYVLAQPVLGADETSWPVLGTRKEAGTWYVWLAHAERAAYYRLEDNRSHKAAEKLLAGYAGPVMCDGYGAYVTLAKKRPGLVLAHCWSHVRREFLEIESAYPKPCAEVLALIGELYAVEASAPEGDDAERSRRRHVTSRAVLDRIVGWVFATAHTTPPESRLQKAIGYLVNRWPGLVRFVDDARIPLDNNGSERDARGPVLGRKNHYGSRSSRGTEVASVFYTLCETARKNGLDPRAYLRLAALRSLRGDPVVLPHEVTPDLVAAYGPRSPPDADVPA
jgi:transposase